MIPENIHYESPCADVLELDQPFCLSKSKEEVGINASFEDYTYESI